MSVHSATNANHDAELNTNPYAAPQTYDDLPSGGFRHLSVKFTVADEASTILAIRRGVIHQSAETLGCIALVVSLIVTMVATMAFPVLLFSAFVGSAIFGLVVRDLVARRISRSRYKQTVEETGIFPQAQCELRLRKTRIVLVTPTRRSVFLLSGTSLQRFPKYKRHPHTVMILKFKSQIILPIDHSADFGDSNSEEFAREFSIRQKVCQVLRICRWKRNLRRRWGRGR